MDASLSIEFFCIYPRQEMFLILNLEYDHISIRFRYNSYAMIGNDFDEVNCYGFSVPCDLQATGIQLGSFPM
jgi:hypothetical protein